MAVFTNDLRLTELATGEGSGTWGTTTNTNLSLLAESFSFGTEAITTNADTHTTTIADGATDPGRSLFLKYTGTLDSACTITIGPNTVSKLWLIENATSGSQNIIIKQGSGATVTVPNGQTKAIYSDGAGSGGAMVDAFQDLSIPDLFIDDDLTFTSDSAVITFGADGDTTLTHTDGSGLTLNSTNKLMFNDASQFIQGSSATVLSLGATDEIDLTATLIDINGNADVSGTVTATGTSVFANLDISGDIDVDGTTNLDVVDIDGAVDMATTLQVTGNLTTSGNNTFTVTDNTAPLTLVSTDADANAGPFLDFWRNSSSPADADPIGQIRFYGENDNDEAIVYSAIDARIVDVSDGTEDGRIEIATILAGTAGVSRLLMDATETVVNDNSKDLDFRVESDGNANMLFVDASTDRIGIGIASPNSMLHLFDGGSDTRITLQSQVAANATASVLLMSRDVSNVNHNTTLTAAGGDFTVDTGGDIILDADGSTITMKDGGTTRFTFNLDATPDLVLAGGNASITASTQDADLSFIGNDGGSDITALFFDMSQAGRATFNEGIVAKTSTAGGFGLTLNTASGDSMKLQVTDTGTGGAADATISVSDGDLTLDVSGDIILDADGGDINFKDGGTTFGFMAKTNNDLLLGNVISDGDVLIRGNDGGSNITAASFDMSEGGNATFSGSVTANPSGGVITLGANGHITSKQSLDVITAGGRYIGSSNRGLLGQLRIEQTAQGADGGYVALDTCAVGSTSPTERMRIDSSGDLLVGHTASIASAGEAHELQVYDTNFSLISATTFRNGSDGAALSLGHSRSGTIGTQTVLQDGDIMGAINFLGSDGTDLANFGAAIRGNVDGTPGANDMPGRLSFLTTADGSNSPTERMRITSNGNVGFSVTPVTDNLSSFLNVQVGQNGVIMGRQSAASLSIADNVYRANAGSTGYKAITTAASSMISQGGGQIDFYTNASASAGADVTLGKMMTIFSSEIRINDDGADNDFRVESDDNANMLFVDGGEDRVGVGTGSPTFTFDVVGGVSTNGSAVRNMMLFDTSNASQNCGGGITFGGNTNGSGGAVNDFATIQGVKENGTDGNYDTALRFSTRLNNASPVEHMRIKSSGYTVFGDGDLTTSVDSSGTISDDQNKFGFSVKNTITSGSPYGLLVHYTGIDKNDASHEFITCIGLNTLRHEVRSNGGIANFQSNDANLCDEREKKNIEATASQWALVKGFDIKQFHYNDEADSDAKRLGVIAQEVETYAPELITDWQKQKARDEVLWGADEALPDGVSVGDVKEAAVEEVLRKGVKEQQMMWMAIKALQEAQTRIETLEAEVAALKGE